VKIAIVIVVLLNLNGEVDHKTTIEQECPDMNVIATKLEQMKQAGAILDYGAACLPAQFKGTKI
jgi:hypothetical protein